MDSLPSWAVWIITAAGAGLSLGLASLMVGAISRSLWPRSKETLGPERVRDEAAIAGPPG
jgi:hypothetical protein